MSTQTKLFLRRGEAEMFLGLPEKVFTQLVEIEAIKPRHLVWEVNPKSEPERPVRTRNPQGKPFQTTEAKAREYVAKNPGWVCRAIGKAYFVRVELEEFAAAQHRCLAKDATGAKEVVA